jgi:AraC-like DNA-binding protein
MMARDNLLTSRATRRKTQPEPMHETSNLRGVFGALERLGYDVDALIAPFGILRSVIEDKDACISGQVCEAVLARAQEQRRVKNLPLQVARNIPLGANPLVDYIVASSDTVAEGIQRLARYLPLQNPGTCLNILDQEDPVRIVIENPVDPFRVQLTVALSILHLTRETGGKLKAEWVSLCKEPEDASEFEQVLGCPIETEASWNGWSLTQKAWQLPLVHSDPLLRRWLEGKAEEILKRQPRGTGMTLEVRQLLAKPIPGEEISIRAVARRLAMTPRTLQRRLAQEGTSYEVLREITLKDAAETFLADPALSISEVAYLLGYSEPGAFHRAFRRWHNVTPLAFRQQKSARSQDLLAPSTMSSE